MPGIRHLWYCIACVFDFAKVKKWTLLSNKSQMGGCKIRFLGDFILSKQLHLLISVANFADIFWENRIIQRHACIFFVNLCCPFNVYLKACEHRKTSIFAQIGPLLAISFCFEVSNAERRQQKIGILFSKVQTTKWEFEKDAVLFDNCKEDINVETHTSLTEETCK